jgi:hypothetical protein
MILLSFVDLLQHLLLLETMYPKICCARGAGFEREKVSRAVIIYRSGEVKALIQYE